MSRRKHRRRHRRERSRVDDLIFGVILIVTGSVVLAARQGVLGEIQVGSLWPLIIVAFGVAHALGGRLAKGFLVIVIGAALQASVWGYMAFQDTWPLLLIVAGVGMALGARGASTKRPPAGDQPDATIAEESRDVQV